MGRRTNKRRTPMTAFRHFRPPRGAFLLGISLLVAGCASVTPPWAGDDAPPEPESSVTSLDPGEGGELITSSDIAKTGATTAWEALERLVKFGEFTRTSRGEPDRIKRRGHSTLVLHEDMRVYLDNIRVVDVKMLDEIPVVSIDYIRVLTGLDGTTRYGTGAGDGVILIFTRARD
jgi:hypothetical protein